MSSEHKGEAYDLAAVHRFYVGLAQRALGHEVVVPDALQSTLAEGAEPATESLETLRRWLNLLDLATTPPMVRDALKESTQETAAALLRYFVSKSLPGDDNRDKVDFVATFLYRTPRPGNEPAPAPQQQDAILERAAQEAADFEKELRRILGDPGTEELPNEHLQLTKEFGFVRAEVEEFNDFDRMMDSGVVQRAREIKQSFGRNFYHPKVLAAVASYNAYFGRRFDELFRKAAQQIKGYAARVQEEGGSILSRVDGDVILKHLTEVEEQKILTQEYGRAQEQFRRVSRYKKAVETRRGGRATAAAAAAPAPAPASAPDSGGKSAASGRVPPSRAATDEEMQTRGMLDSIRSFVRASTSGAVIMPMRTGNLPLSPAEADAFRADYATENSFRGQYVSVLAQCVAIQARMMTEMLEYSKHKKSAYLWKGPADALAALLAAATKQLETGSQVAEMARKRGLDDKAAALQHTLEKLRQQSQTVTKLLSEIGS